MGRALVNIYKGKGDELFLVALARMPGEGPWVEVEPVEHGVDGSAVERALERSAELSGSTDLPSWDGGGIRDDARLVARVERTGEGSYAYVPQTRVHDESGAWWASEPREDLPSLDSIAERVRAS